VLLVKFALLKTRIRRAKSVEGTQAQVHGRITTSEVHQSTTMRDFF
jgi:hypothetical protein